MRSSVVPKISVIMPVYNIVRIKHKFDTAVNSIINQTWLNWELIIINDGSEDTSETILKKYSTKDSRILLVNKDNGGVESSRRLGIKMANGDFIIHIDQDDCYKKNALEVFYNNISSSDADVAIANRLRFIFSTHFTFGKSIPFSMKEAKTIEHDEFMDRYYQSFFGINDLPVSIWNKMYRKSFLDRIPDPPLTGLIIEDLSYNMHVLPYASRICIIPEYLYYYRWGGFTNRFDKTILDTAITGYRLKMCQIERYGLFSFRHTTAVELLNYLNSYFLSLVCYTNIDKTQFVNVCNNVYSLSEVIESINIVNKEDKYHNDYIDAMLSSNYEVLFEIESQNKRNTRNKRLLKRVLLKF